MEENNSLIRYIIGASRIKFEVLDQLYAGINMNQYRMAVMYVDAHSIFYRLYKERNLANLYSTNKSELIRDLVIGFLNVLGHYRRYMATRMGLDNDIYVMFNRESPRYNEKCYEGFNKKLYSRYNPDDPNFGFISSALEISWQFILGLSPYFEGIYCIDNTGIDDFALMSKLGFADDIFYTIYSKNMYGTQLIRPNVVQLFNRRDNSRLITEGSCYKNGILFDLKTKASEKLTPDMLPLLWTFSGCTDVSVANTKYVQRISTMIKAANNMANDGILICGMSIQSFLDSIGDYITSNNTTSGCSIKLAIKIDRNQLIKRYRALSPQLAAAAITSDQWAKITAQLYDIYDENELEHLNDLLASGNVDPMLLEITNLNMSIAPKYDYDIYCE